MKVRTEIKITPQKPLITYKSGVFSIGSCFSEHIGLKLGHLKYNVSQNPCGITFNPASLLTTVKRTYNPESLHESQLILNNGLYSHPDFHSSFNQLSSESYLKYTSQTLNAASDSLKNTTHCLITIGTCYVFRAKNSGKIVNNCHKLPASDFTQELLSIPQVLSQLEEIRALIMDHSDQSPEFIFTASPVRHLKNGLVDDRKSKSTALLAIHEIVTAHHNCHYFPSYEIMTDDLRDYRYYNADLIHPSTVAIDYIFDLFSGAWLDSEEEALRKKVTSIQNRLAHKPLFPDSEAHLSFQKKLYEDIENIRKEHSILNDRF